MNRILLITWSLLLLTACQNGSSSGGETTSPGPLNKSSVMGAWEVTAVQWPAGKTEALASGVRTQYEITDGGIKEINADAAGVLSVIEALYQINGNTIVVADSNTVVNPDPTVLSVDSKTMIWKMQAMPLQAPPEANLVLTRITPQELVTNSANVVEHFRAEYGSTIKGVLQVSSMMEVKVTQNSSTSPMAPTNPTTTTTTTTKGEASIACRTTKDGDLDFSLVSTKKAGRHTVMSEAVKFQMNLTFDRSKPEELITASDETGTRVTKLASVQDQSKAVRFNSSAITSCGYKVHRRQRLVTVEFDCKGLTLGGVRKANSIFMRGDLSCVLEAIKL